MHAYITDSDERRDVPFYLAAAAVFVSLSVSTLFGLFKITIPGWLDITSVPLLYGLLYAAFNKSCWRWSLFRRLKIVKVPALHGEWRGYVLSIHDDFKTKHEVNLRIEQEWSRMRIKLKGDLSRSHSFLAAVLVDAPDGVVLDYEYLNEPLPGAREAMQIHHGTTRLNVVSRDVMDGYYYTGRGRGTYGHIHLSRDTKIVKPNRREQQ